MRRARCGGSDAIRYWTSSHAGWTPLNSATLGADYALQYQSTGDLAGYTLLTVLAPGPPVPEPGTFALVELAVAILLPGCRLPRKRRR